MSPPDGRAPILECMCGTFLGAKEEKGDIAFLDLLLAGAKGGKGYVCGGEEREKGEREREREREREKGERERERRMVAAPNAQN